MAKNNKVEILFNMFYKMSVDVVFVGGENYRIYSSSGERTAVTYGAGSYGHVSSGFA